jgi:hypothetical protein
VQDLCARRRQPGEQPGHGGLILEPAVHDSYDPLHAGGELFEVEQGLWRNDPRHPNLASEHQRLYPGVKQGQYTLGA